MDKRLKQLRPLAMSCSERELSILACSIEEIFQSKEVDAMAQTLSVQVVSYSVSYKLFCGILCL